LKPSHGAAKPSRRRHGGNGFFVLFISGTMVHSPQDFGHAVPNGSFKIIHLSCETFSNKVYSKIFSSLMLHSKGLTKKFIKSLPNWI
jgi:hypothetical protein